MADVADPVSVCARAMVLPAQPTPPHPFFLSCFDLFWQDIHYNHRLIFYESSLPADPGPQGGSDGLRAAALMEKLKHSLALCLVHYYPWCGRIAKSAEPPHRLLIDCCDAGVEFVEASSPLYLSQLARDGFQSKPFVPQLCQQPDHTGNCLFSSPLLSIQATLFADGGLVIGIAHSHVVADGQALWNFMVSWGECARGVPLSLPPLHSREMLAVLDPSPDRAISWSLTLQVKEDNNEEEESYSRMGNPPTREDHKCRTRSAGVDSAMNEDADGSVEVGHRMVTEMERIVESKRPWEDADSSAEVNNENEGSKDHANHVETDRYKERSTAGTEAPCAGDTTEPLVECMLDLSAAAIKKLKSEAGGGHTSFEVICSHFWKHFSAARELAANEPTYFFTPVNCRNRMTPPIPASYFGNVIAFDLILSTEGAIRKETLCATACRVHDLVAKINEEFVVDFMHWLEMHNNRVVDVFPPSSPMGKGINGASSPWFPVYEVDYGWGKPVAVRSGKVYGDGELVLFGGRPGSERGDVEICTALPESVLKRLLDDPTFLARLPSNRFG